MTTKLCSDSFGTDRPVANKTLTNVQDGALGPRASGEKVLVWIDNLFLRTDALIHRVIPHRLNPLTQSGAIANTTFLIALASGILLLLWYSPSVYKAYTSLEAVRNGSWLGQWVRSLHRYSSDACIFFVILHALRIVTARRFFGARWMAWVTGSFLLGILWLLGWTGYWLVWDVRAQHVAEGSARFLDVLPIFGQPLASSFLTNDNIPSLLFFLVFFAHMLLPLAIGIGLWLHLSRVSRPKILTNRPLTIWIVGSLLLLSLIYPATSSTQADLGTLSEGFTMDWWFLWPLALTDRLSGGALWGLFLFGTLAFVSVPWWMRKRSSSPIAHAVVDLDACHGCTLCAKDCPFDAITMVSRTDDCRIPVQAEVNPDRCVGCGICTGACDSDAISLPWLDIKDVKEQLDRWVDAALRQSKNPMLAFLCSSSAANSFSFDAVTGECPDLPGFRVKAVPCSGWVSPRLIEHCLQNGAGGILIVGCGPGEQVFREGSAWLKQRLAGSRRPILRKRRIDVTRVQFVQFDRTQPGALREAAQAFREGVRKGSRRRSGVAGAIGGIVLAGALAAVVGFGSDRPYTTANSSPVLMISFRHPGEPITEAKELTPEERERLPVHMRGQVLADRTRAPVRMRVYADKELVLEKTYPPRGFHSDGPSVALEKIELEAGRRGLRVELNDTADATAWPHTWEASINIKTGRRHVLYFEGTSGFRLE